MCNFVHLADHVVIKLKNLKCTFSELEEECCQTSDCVLEGVTFYVAYICSLVMELSAHDLMRQSSFHKLTSPEINFHLNFL